ncbi:MAG: hypothetical protein KAW56_09690 [Candidatus Marinimicrobia bacterium]|nr:hypothetical protein [Candidatus Neomarinimicrobiota bacterium]
MRYLLTQFEIIVVLGVFTYFQNLTNWTIAISILYFIWAIFKCYLFFRWITKIIVPKELFSLIFKTVNFTEIDKISSYLEAPKEQFETSLKNYAGFYETKSNELDLLFRKSISIRTHNKGLVSQIDLKEIDEILKEKRSDIDKVVFYVKISDLIPDPSSPYDQTSKKPQLLISILPKLDEPKKDGEFFSNDIEQDKFSEISKYIEKNEKELEKCINIDSSKSSFGNYLEITSDLLSVYEKGVAVDISVAQNFLENMNDFIYSEYKKSDNKKLFLRFRIINDMFQKILERITEIQKYDPTSILLSDILETLYLLRDLAIVQENTELIYSILNVLNDIFRRKLIYSNQYSSHLEYHLQDIQAITFSYEMMKKLEEDSDKEDFKDNWSKLYSPIINKGIESATIAYLNHIKWAYKQNQNDSELYLKRNAQFLIDFMKPIINWNNFEQNNTGLKEFWAKQQTNNMRILARSILYISIIIYKKVQEKELPEKYIWELSFPFADYCNNIDKYNSIKSEEYLSDYFYEYEFNTPYGSYFSEWFEVSPIHEVGAYTPRYYNFDSFWLSLSLYRKSMGQKFIPNINPNSEYKKRKLKEFCNFIKESKIQDIEINKESQWIDKNISKYIEYIEHLLEDDLDKK